MCEQVELGLLRQEHLRAGDSLLLPPGEAAAFRPLSSSAGGRGTDGYWAGEAPELATLTLLLPDSDAPGGAVPHYSLQFEERQQYFVLSYYSDLGQALQSLKARMNLDECRSSILCYLTKAHMYMDMKASVLSCLF